MDIQFDSIFSFNYHEKSQFVDFTHHTDELIYFISGEGTTTINDKSYEYRPHTICYNKSGDIKSNHCIKKTDYICIRFNCSHNDLDSGIYNVNGEDLFTLFTKVQKEIMNKNYHYYNICNLYIGEILYKISRMEVVHTKDEPFYNLIREIDQTLNFNKSIQDMANSLSYSYDHFRHKFKELTGQPPTSYIINKRIENACMLLQESKHSCTTISFMCGFSSSAQFSKLFKRVIGISPVEYSRTFKTM